MSSFVSTTPVSKVFALDSSPESHLIHHRGSVHPLPSEDMPLRLSVAASDTSLVDQSEPQDSSSISLQDYYQIPVSFIPSSKSEKQFGSSNSLGSSPAVNEFDAQLMDRILSSLR
jgi:hypothetical protein